MIQTIYNRTFRKWLPRKIGVYNALDEMEYEIIHELTDRGYSGVPVIHARKDDKARVDDNGVRT